MSKGLLRVALVGCGYVSPRHLHSWQVIPEAEVVALCEINEHRLHWRGEEFGISCQFTSVDQLLRNIDFDIADITTRPDSHKPLVSIMAKAGKHILCQKPFAPTLEDAYEMVEICEKYKVRIMVCENWRWFSWYQTIKKQLLSDVVGEIKYASMVAHGSATLPLNDKLPLLVQGEQSYLKERERLIIYEKGIHLVDVFRFLFGDPSALYAITNKTSSWVKGEDSAILVLNFDHMSGVLDMSWASRELLNNFPNNEKLLIEGTESSMILDPGGKIRVVDNRGREELINYEVDASILESHIRVHKHFISCLLGDKPFQTDARDNSKSLEITLKAYESAQMNRVVRLKGF